MPTLLEYFTTDFKNVLNIAAPFKVEIGGEMVEFPVRVHFDFDSNSKFLSCYLPSILCSTEICNGLIHQVEQALTIGDKVEVQTSLPGELARISTDLHFAGRLFIYCEAEISEEEQDAIRKLAGSQNIFVQFRGPQFALERTRIEKPLAFISHDSKDKKEIAKPIARELIGLMCPVWYDDFSLTVGDSLRESIERGLTEAKKCVLIITPNFLNNTGWTKTEFNAIFTRELVEKRNVILPVRCGVTRDDVYKYSPVLADRVAVDWGKGLKETVRALKRAISV